MRAIDVSIPEGYEYSHMAEPVLSDGGGILQVVLKKKNIKTFDFYVDEYLRNDYNTTNDMLCNWFYKDQLEKIGNNLKQNKLQFVPWEVKIGLLKFICNDIHIPWGEYIHQFNGSVYSSEIIAVTKIIPIGFRDEIIIN